jgi:hypothetical protein
MSKFSRSIPIAALILGLGAASVSAQGPVQGDFQWYVGGQGGVFVFRTPTQTRGGIATAGGHTLITARRTGLLVSIDEAFSGSQSSGYTDAAGTFTDVTFSDVRRYSAVLMAFPIRSAAQPYLGVGGGLLHAVNPTPTGTFATPADIAQAQADARDLGTAGFLTGVAGVQFKVGRLVAFGQYQITSSPGNETLASGAAGRLFVGSTHTFSGGLRVSLGSARETTRAGY